MQIQKHTVVSLLYTLRENNASGEVIEVVQKEQPFTFLYGVGQLLPLFEDNIKGLEVGNNFAFSIEAAQAYGEMNPNAIVQLPIETFIVNGELATDLLQVGSTIPMRNEEGHLMQGQVLEVTEQFVKMDFNHPMAGKNLHFTGEVVALREAEETEIAHGHVHGPGGHHH